MLLSFLTPHPPFLAQLSASDAEGDIRDIHGPIAIASPWRTALWVGLGLALLILSCVLWRIWQRSRQKKNVPLDPYAIALAELDQAHSVIQSATGRDFSIAVSQSVRRYIEARFSIAATHHTTEEFLHHLLGASIDPSRSPSGSLASHRARLETFLQHCDFAKFGRGDLSLPEREALWQSARDFVADTRPVPISSATPSSIPLSSPPTPIAKVPPSA